MRLSVVKENDLTFDDNNLFTKLMNNEFLTSIRLKYSYHSSLIDFINIKTILLIAVINDHQGNEIKLRIFLFFAYDYYAFQVK